jgi:hypothetical protein
VAARHVTIPPQNAKASDDGILAWAQESSKACVGVVTWVRSRRRSGKGRRSTGEEETSDRGAAGPILPFPVGVVMWWRW